jgi:hypothetical protein
VFKKQLGIADTAGQNFHPELFSHYTWVQHQNETELTIFAWDSERESHCRTKWPRNLVLNLKVYGTWCGLSSLLSRTIIVA